jgi:peptidoglycan/LPS O-acetylase OafA/YrhL
MPVEPSRADSAATAVSPARRDDLPVLTGLRFLAAFSVLIGHGAAFILNFETRDYDFVYWLRQASGFGMTLFFVLSGFVIHYNYRISVTQGGGRGLGAFLWARFARLYPLFILTLPFNLLFSKRIFDLAAGDGTGFQGILEALPYFLTFTQSWFYVPIHGLPLISVVGAASPLTWSISTEWFFYLCYPLIALVLVRMRRPITAGIAAVGWCIAWTAVAIYLFDHRPEINEWAVSRFGRLADMSADLGNSYLRWLLYFSPYVRIGEFVLGCLVGELYLQLRGHLITGREALVGQAGLVLAFFSVLLLTYVTYGPVIGHDFFHKLNWNFALAPSAAIIVFCAARYVGPVARLLTIRPVLALGEASYSIYLLHFFVLIIVARLSAEALPATPTNVAFAVTKLIVLVAFILLISLASFAYFEAPARAWLRGLMRGPSGPARPILAMTVAASPIAAAAILVFATPTVLSGLQFGLGIVASGYNKICTSSRDTAFSQVSKTCDAIGRAYEVQRYKLRPRDGTCDLPGAAGCQ